jgi:hypothetical protein
MLPISRAYAHIVFAVIQSGMTTAIAAAIATEAGGGGFWLWLKSWMIAWTMLIPVVVVAAPKIRRLSMALTRE